MLYWKLSYWRMETNFSFQKYCLEDLNNSKLNKIADATYFISTKSKTLYLMRWVWGLEATPNAQVRGQTNKPQKQFPSRVVGFE